MTAREEEKNMKRLENVGMAQTWTCYAGALYGSLKAAGMWGGDLDTLMGETGILFQFIMADDCCPSGVTVYNWKENHYAMADRIGIANDVLVVHKEPQWNTFEAAQELAVVRIKESIDRGVAPIVWAPTPLLEFGLISGYDDDEHILYPVHCLPNEPDPTLYENFALSEVPIIHVQSFYKKCEYDREKTVRNSLRFGVEHWNSDSHVTPNYGSGKKAWENMISALERKSFSEFGLTYCMNVYAESKRRLPAFLSQVAGIADYFAPLKEASALYSDVSAQTESMAKTLPFDGPESTVKEEDVPALLESAKRAYEIETKAMVIIEQTLET
jgi:hypothetical protein